MIVLGLDVATKTGWSLYDTGKPLSAIVSGAFSSSGDSSEQKCYDHAGHLINLFRQYGNPDFVVIESPLKTSPLVQKQNKLMGKDDGVSNQIGGLTAVISSNQFIGATLGLLRGYGMPWELVSSATWRKNAFGAIKNGTFDRPGWKKHAKERCRDLGISVSNADQAEAVWIAFYGPKCQSFRMLELKMQKKKNAK